MSFSESADFIRMQEMTFDSLKDFQFSRLQRRKLLDTMLDYYRLHLNDFPDIKSLDIMQELFEG